MTVLSTSPAPSSRAAPAEENKRAIRELGGVEVLRQMAHISNDRLRTQVARALANLGCPLDDAGAGSAPPS